MRIVNIIYRFLLSTLLLLLPVQILIAQNNPFKIDDELYKYYDRCVHLVKQPKVLKMCDTLIVMSKKKGDIKAQCLAYALRGDYFYYNQDLKNLLIEKKKTIGFVSKTPFKQYIFSIWNRVIAYYLMRSMLDEALVEVKKYQAEALRLNNAYGIGFGYKKLSDLYSRMGYSKLALTELHNAERYYQENGMQRELYNIYSAIANAYLNDSQLDEAKRYYLLALNNSPLEQSKGALYVPLMRIYLQSNDIREVEKYRDLLERWKKQYSLTELSQNAEIKFYADYYMLKKDYQKALVYCNQIGTFEKYLYLSLAYRGLQDYKNAYQASAEYFRLYSNETQKSQRESIAENSAKFNNERIEKEKSLLELKNTQLMVAQLRSREQFLSVDRVRHLLALSNARLELNNKDLALQRQKADYAKQKAEVERQKAEARHQAALKLNEHQKVRSNWIYAIAIISFLLLLSVSLLVYAMMRRRAARSLMFEVHRANRARSEAEKAKVESEKLRVEAEEARAEAVKADQMKTLFIQNMSHEIRTPLNAIVGFSDLLSDDAMNIDAAQKHEFVKLIHENTNLLTMLIDDILDLSKLESGGLGNLHIEKINATDICHQAIEPIKVKMNKGVQLISELPSNDIIIETDGSRTIQILLNLLLNACKYTERGYIKLGVSSEDGKAVFIVEDTGCGIAPENSELIFQRFVKLNSFKQGTGLGLSICRALAELLNGEVKLDTTYTGGARFLLILPLSISQ